MTDMSSRFLDPSGPLVVREFTDADPTDPRLWEHRVLTVPGRALTRGPCLVCGSDHAYVHDSATWQLCDNDGALFGPFFPR